MPLDAEPTTPLPPIPVIDVGPEFPLETLECDPGRAHALLDAATRGVPLAALRALDAVSRRWIARCHVPGKLDELDAIAARLSRPGAYFLSVNYEWGCTCRVGAGSDGEGARLVRVLDWRTEGLGRYVMAARVAGRAGRYTALTWPGYTGVLQAVAPGRFAAALNQAPMTRPVGVMALDWAVNRVRVWNRPHLPPAHLLRAVCDEARTFAEARERLTRTPIAAPCIFSLSGVMPGEAAVIERTEERANVFEGDGVAANHWLTPGWTGRNRGIDSAGRARRMRSVTASPDDDAFPWLQPPILNPRTRLVMVADARTGKLAAQGWEAAGPATAVLHLTA